MICLKSVSKSYGKNKAVQDISFEIQDTEVVGLLGPNGAGKTTTINMIAGYIATTDGTILINNIDIAKEPLKAKKQIGYMPENVPLYNELTVKEFLIFMAELNKVPKQEIPERIEKVLKEIKIEDVEKKIIKTLSKGYKQRVSLAGTLISNPKIIILDEPMSGLDPKQIAQMREVIKSLKKEHIVIMSSHILAEISQMCDKVIIIDKGKILKILDPKQIKGSLEKEYLKIVSEKEKDEQ